MSAPAADDTPAPPGQAGIVEFLRRSGLLPPGYDPVMVPLTGGVASDIWRVDGPHGSVVVKRALARLRVAQVWAAPVSRNGSEVSWMKEAARIVPAAVPAVLAHDPELGAFAMDYLEPATYPVWKAQLLNGRVDPTTAAAVGRVLVAIHAGTAASPALAHRFANESVFHSIRLEPYFEATAKVQPDLRGQLEELVADTLASKLALVHGDVSPKNILIGPGGPVFLDAECACYGEPAFDLAFCLNHLLLKCLAVPALTSTLLASFGRLSSDYLAGVGWEPAEDLERRAARLLPALLLARVDGKSPVEYIAAEEQKAVVRRAAKPMIARPPRRLSDVAAAWAEELRR